MPHAGVYAELQRPNACFLAVVFGGLADGVLEVSSIPAMGCDTPKDTPSRRGVTLDVCRGSASTNRKELEAIEPRPRTFAALDERSWTIPGSGSQGWSGCAPRWRPAM